MKCPNATPWGAAQSRVKIADGIWKVTTASHGGIWVAPNLRGKLVVKETPFSKGGWFEEDCDWAFVALSFPRDFSESDLKLAKKTLSFSYGGKYKNLVE